jgi:hypothetical protein
MNTITVPLQPAPQEIDNRVVEVAGGDGARSA